MEITTSMMYWFTRLDAIKMVVQGFGLGFVLLGIFASVMLLVIGYQDQWECRKKLWWTVVIPILGTLFLVGQVFVPTTKEMALIYVVPKISSSDAADTVVEDCGELYGLAKSRLIEILSDDAPVDSGHVYVDGSGNVDADE